MVKPEVLSVIAILQGVACMLSVVALGIATGSHWAAVLAIISLGFAYLATTSFLMIGTLLSGPEVGNGLTMVAIAFGFLSIVVLI